MSVARHIVFRKFFQRRLTVLFAPFLDSSNGHNEICYLFLLQGVKACAWIINFLFPSANAVDNQEIHFPLTTAGIRRSYERASVLSYLVWRNIDVLRDITIKYCEAGAKWNLSIELFICTRVLVSKKGPADVLVRICILRLLSGKNEHQTMGKRLQLTFEGTNDLWGGIFRTLGYLDNENEIWGRIETIYMCHRNLYLYVGMNERSILFCFILNIRFFF